MRARLALVAACACLAPAVAHAAVTVTVENVNPGGSFFFTPFWVAFHDGGFDTYDTGVSAARFPGLTELAEGGDTGPISAAFAMSASGMAGGVDATIQATAFATDAPVLNPGESVTFAVDPGDTSVNRFFSYASMVIPSNDLFVANGNPQAHELFDADGAFLGPVVIEVRTVNDNGTELNDANAGAAFSANGGDGIVEMEDIRMFFDDPAGDAAYLASFDGSQTVTGFEINDAFAAGELIARITIARDAIATCPSDIDCNGQIGMSDLLHVLLDWGPCP